MKKLYFAITTAMVLATACSQQEIEGWQGRDFAWFTSEYVDFTFMDYPEIAEGDSYLVGVPFTIAGPTVDFDREVEVKVSREPLDSRTKYEIQRPVIFHAGKVTSDTMYVKVFNSAHLAEVHDTISFQIGNSSNFEAGLENKLVSSICLFNGYAKPSWWNANGDYYMGYFSQLKAQIYTIVMGGLEDKPCYDSDGWGGVYRQYVSYILKDYVAKNNIVYPEGTVFDGVDYSGKAPQWTNKQY